MKKKFIEKLFLVSLFAFPLVSCGKSPNLKLNDFVICFDEANKLHQKDFANDLQRFLEENGVNLTIKKASEASSENKKILVGGASNSLTNSNSFSIHKSGETIVLDALSSSGYADGLKVLAESLKDCANNNKDLNTVFKNPINGVAVDQNIKVMSFNLRCGDDTYGGNTIAERLPRQVAFIRNELPDTFGCQEAIFTMTDYLQDNLADTYGYVGETRAADSEMCPIFYNKNTVEVLDSGTRWYSSTPDIPGSTLPVSSEYIRIYTFGLFKDIASGNVFLHVNTHLDLDMSAPYEKAEARLLEAQILADFADKYDNIPRFLTADYNCNAAEGDAVYYLEHNRGYVRSSTLSTLHTDTTPTFPWANYSASYNPSSRNDIDFILCKGDNVLVDTYDVHTDEVTPPSGTKGKLSDHYIISSDILLYTPLGGKVAFDLNSYETYRYKTQLNGTYNSHYANSYTYRAIDGLTSGVRTSPASGLEKGAIESISKVGSFQTYRFTSEQETVGDIEYVLSSINYYSSANHLTTHLGSCVTIEVNGKKINIDNYKLPVNGTGDWYNWQKIYIKDVKINKGSNFVKLINTSGTAPNLSHIVVHTDGYLNTDKPVIEGENFNLKVINNKMYGELYIPNKDYEPDEYHLSLDADYDLVVSEIKEKIETGVRLLVDLSELSAGVNYYPHVRINDYFFDNNKGDLVGRETYAQGMIKDTQVFNGRTYTIKWNWNMPVVSIGDTSDSIVKEENTHLEESMKAHFGYFSDTDFKYCSCVTPGNNVFLMGSKEKNVSRFKSAHLTEVGLPILYLRNNQSANSLKLVVMDSSTNKITQIVPLVLSASESAKYVEAGANVGGAATFKVNKWLSFPVDITLNNNEFVGIAVTLEDSLFFGYRNSTGRTTQKDIAPYGLTSFNQSSAGISVGSSLGSYSTNNQSAILINVDFVGDFYFPYSDYKAREMEREVNANREERYAPLKELLKNKKFSAFGDSISSNIDFCNRFDVNTNLKGNYVAYDNKSSGIFSAKNMWWHLLSDDIGTDILVANGFSGDALSSTSTATECRGLDRCVQLHDNVQIPNILPDIIAVYFGVNDFIYKNIAVGTFAKLYESMIQKMVARYPDATIFYSTLAPAANTDFLKRNLEEYLVYNEIIRTIVNKYQNLGYHVALVDMYRDSGITQANLGNLSYDLLHPNADGMRKFADCFLEAMYKYYIK